MALIEILLDSRHARLVRLNAGLVRLALETALGVALEDLSVSLYTFSRRMVRGEGERGNAPLSRKPLILPQRSNLLMEALDGGRVVAVERRAVVPGGLRLVVELAAVGADHVPFE